ncbi:dTDP-4-dehydrorhamnose reductase [Paenibacillus ferrarius]|uniref:dTDP-4-dehydrorhamnose reductase n=1 Tax=Paenibacillus ferrarius TaxID=1469647 RepID=UPI003D2C2942
MKIVITGADGQLGYDLKRVLGSVHKVIALNRKQLDVTDEDAVKRTLMQLQPDAVVHAAAYTNVDRAEAETEAAYQVNALGALHVASACHLLNAKLVHVSTDYVFDGTKQDAYTEQDMPNPINIYGQSKLLGEKFVQLTCSQAFIVRTSWLYGAKGTNFVTKVLEKARTTGELTIVDDQFGSPTYCLDLALMIRELLETEHYGLYHASNSGVCSRFEFARRILQEAGLLQSVLLHPVPTEQLPAVPAKRPMYSAFRHRAIERHGLSPMRDWEAALAFFIRYDYDDSALRKKEV